MNNKNKFRFAILLFGVLSAFIITACSDNNSPDDPSQGENTLPVKQVSLSRKTAYGNYPGLKTRWQRLVLVK